MREGRAAASIPRLLCWTKPYFFGAMLLDDDDAPLPVVLELLEDPAPVAGVTVDSVVPLALPLAGGIEELVGAVAVSGGVVAEEDEVAGGGAAVSVVAEDELVAGGIGGAAVVLLLDVPEGGVTTVVRSSLLSQPARPMASAIARAPVSTRLDFIGTPFVCAGTSTVDAAI